MSLSFTVSAKMRLLVKILLCVCVLCASLRSSGSSNPQHQPDTSENRDYWQKKGNDEITEALAESINSNTAKNVILFVANGMDPNTVTASRIHKEKETGKLSFEKFPHIGLLKTYSVDKKVPDTAASGTALFTGVKTNNAMVGVDSTVRFNDCRSPLNPESRLTSIMNWAQDAGKSTGFVTNKRVTDAVSSALYAHSPSKFWECNSAVPANSLCKDIAQQLVQDEPGQNFKVIFGGGRQTLMDISLEFNSDKVDHNECSRTDRRHLIKEWMENKASRDVKYRVIKDTRELLEFQANDTEYVLGIFGNSHITYEETKNHSNEQPPPLDLMVESAIKILQKSENGFVMMVENGLIDKAHQDNHAARAIEGTLVLDKTIQTTIDILTKAELLEETLIIVTGGYGHTMSINGYPSRAESILGIADKSKYDSIPYTILTYATGDGESFHYKSNYQYVTRDDPTRKPYTSRYYTQLAAIRTDRETNGGGDVAVYARGPMAHLFHGVHESTYVAHAIAYASKIGQYTSTADEASKCPRIGVSSFIFVAVLVTFKFS